MRPCKYILLALTISAASVAAQSASQNASRPFRPTIPKLWDEKELTAMTLPPARQEGHIVYVSSEYFYRTPGLQIYKSYPVYRPDREPEGYFDWLRKREPVFAFDASTLDTEADWTRAGETAFTAPTYFESVND